MEKLWAARDKDNRLFIYNNKPVRHKEYDSFDEEDESFGVDINNHNRNIIYFENVIEVNAELFPELTWENSPQQIELTLTKNN